MLSKCLEAFPLHFSVLVPHWSSSIFEAHQSIRCTRGISLKTAFRWSNISIEWALVLADWALISNSRSRSKAAGEVPLSGGKLETMAKLMLSADPCRRAHFGRMAMAQDRHLDSQHNILSWPLACFAAWTSLKSHLDHDVARSLFWFQLNP